MSAEERPEALHRRAPTYEHAPPKYLGAIAHPTADCHSGAPNSRWASRHEETDGDKAVDEAGDVGRPGDRLPAGTGRAAEDAEEHVESDPYPGDGQQRRQAADLPHQHQERPEHPPDPAR